ncbi:hypothetical protein BDV95DRAFT_56759 [Massariosphaeria phaeospora]|uniref:Uncharacterized protein n=1 Tax=Massariosphaeria phaeospora TaxID=100035 RepID=A0A7C8M5K9_9PLEO|nr:hypothetical protein BDV95DRAFT_56759 [Massariosphaeria phaeospora]
MQLGTISSAYPIAPRHLFQRTPESSPDYRSWHEKVRRHLRQSATIVNPNFVDEGCTTRQLLHNLVVTAATIEFLHQLRIRKLVSYRCRDDVEACVTTYKTSARATPQLSISHGYALQSCNSHCMSWLNLLFLPNRGEVCIHIARMGNIHPSGVV